MTYKYIISMIYIPSKKNIKNSNDEIFCVDLFVCLFVFFLYQDKFCQNMYSLPTVVVFINWTMFIVFRFNPSCGKVPCSWTFQLSISFSWFSDFVKSVLSFCDRSFSEKVEYLHSPFLVSKCIVTVTCQLKMCNFTSISCSQLSWLTYFCFCIFSWIGNFQMHLYVVISISL